MIETFIRRPVFTTMFILLLVVFGIRCYPEIGVDLNPDVDMPIVSVRVTYDGASPEEMETLITKPIETASARLQAIKQFPVPCLKATAKPYWSLTWA